MKNLSLIENDADPIAPERLEELTGMADVLAFIHNLPYLNHVEKTRLADAELKQSQILPFFKGNGNPYAAAKGKKPVFGGA